MRILPFLLIPFLGLFNSQATAQAFSLEPEQKLAHLLLAIKKQLVLRCILVPSLINLF